MAALTSGYLPILSQGLDSPEHSLGNLTAFIWQWKALSEEGVPGKPSSTTLPLACNFLVDGERWTALPLEWRSFVENVQEEAFEEVLTDMRRHLRISGSKEKLGIVVPPTLAQWLEDVHSNSICRRPTLNITPLCLAKPLLHHMTPKKRHEVKMMGGIVAGLMEEMKVTTVVDVGSGLGYLSHALAFSSRARVISVECEELHYVKNGKRAADLLKRTDSSLTSAEGEASCSSGENGASSSQGEDSSLADRICVIQHKLSLGEDFFRFLSDSVNTDIQNVGVIGLHTCGNLATTMMDLFLQHEHISLLVDVGCCYSKDVCGAGHGETWQPRSKQAMIEMESMPGGSQVSLLSEGSLMAACHANHTPGLKGLELTFYRLLFQRLLSQFIADVAVLSEVRCGRVKSAVTFRQYCVKVAANLRPRQHGKQIDSPIYLEIQEDDCETVYMDGTLRVCHSYLDGYFEKNSALRRRVMFYWTLRNCFGEAIESLLLIDRAVNMREQGVNAHLAPIFAPSLSPRQIALIAWRERRLCKSA